MGLVREEKPLWDKTVHEAFEDTEVSDVLQEVLGSDAAKGLWWKNQHDIAHYFTDKRPVRRGEHVFDASISLKNQVTLKILTLHLF
ncbi:MAG: hypothetical protein ABEJ93_02195 [Candidatus Nanohalobium sp.]